MSNPIATAQRLDWRGWVFGIWSALMTAGAGAASAAIGTMVVDPNDFNLHGGLSKLLEVMAVSFVIPGVQSMLKFLSTHPLPDPSPQQVVANVETSLKVIPVDPTQPATTTKTSTPVMGPAPTENHEDK